MYWPLWLAPLVLFAELLHLILAERHLGVAALKAGRDPRLGEQPRAWVGWLWFLSAAVGIAYPGLLVFFSYSRFQALTMMLVTVVGFEVRRRSGMKWALVTLTVEGAVRVGMIVQLLGLWYFFGSPSMPGMPEAWR